MNDNLPPLPELPPPEVEEWSETFITLRGEGWKKETVEKYATDYARAAIEKDRAERQCVPAGYVRVPIEPTEAMTDATYVGQHCSDIWRDMIAAAPHPKPGPMAATAEEAARDVQKCLNERDGHGLDLRHVAMLVHHVQQSQGETK